MEPVSFLGHAKLLNFISALFSSNQEIVFALITLIVCLYISIGSKINEIQPKQNC